MKQPMNKKQPKDGDRVLHCGHRDAESWHWWFLPNSMEFRRPDQTIGNADWIVGCEPCAQAAGFDSRKIGITGDGKWMGNAPVIPAAS
jgi:hypothetical protein